MYYRARYYSTVMGRFIRRDPKGYVDGMNLYAGYFVPGGTDPYGTGSVLAQMWTSRATVASYGGGGITAYGRPVDPVTAMIRASFRRYRSAYRARQRARVAAYRQRMRAWRAGVEQRGGLVIYAGGRGGGGLLVAGSAGSGGVSAAPLGMSIWEVERGDTLWNKWKEQRSKKGGIADWGEFYKRMMELNPEHADWNKLSPGQTFNLPVDDEVAYWDRIAAMLDREKGYAGDEQAPRHLMPYFGIGLSGVLGWAYGSGSAVLAYDPLAPTWGKSLAVIATEAGGLQAIGAGGSPPSPVAGLLYGRDLVSARGFAGNAGGTVQPATVNVYWSGDFKTWAVDISPGAGAEGHVGGAGAQVSTAENIGNFVARSPVLSLLPIPGL